VLGVWHTGERGEMCWVSGTQGREEKCAGCLAYRGERRNVLGIWHTGERGEIYKKCMKTLKKKRERQFKDT